MLVLTRKPGEGIWIGEEIRVSVLGFKGSSVRIGIEAHQDLSVRREEVERRVQEENARAAQAVTLEVSVPAEAARRTTGGAARTRRAG